LTIFESPRSYADADTTHAHTHTIFPSHARTRVKANYFSMRPRAIQGVPGLHPDASPFDRFQQFARMIAAVPKSEVEKKINKSGSAKKDAGRRGHNGNKT
jgi:hypothetical protein